MSSLRFFNACGRKWRRADLTTINLNSQAFFLHCLLFCLLWMQHHFSHDFDSDLVSTLKLTQNEKCKHWKKVEVTSSSLLVVDLATRYAYREWKIKKYLPREMIHTIVDSQSLAKSPRIFARNRLTPQLRKYFWWINEFFNR